jgi:hypothetical protein
MRNLRGILATVPRVEPGDSLLNEARLQFRASVARERLRAGVIGNLLEGFRRPAVYRPAIGFACLALVVAGFMGGRYVSLPNGEIDGMSSTLGEGAHIANVRLVRGGSPGNDVEVAFDAVRPVRLRGSVNDPSLQKVLAYALVNEENPGVRLRAIGVVATSTWSAPEPEVKAALLLALQSDPNDGVRKEALKAILRCPADREIRDGLLYVLLHDKNPGLRIAAINGLDSLRGKGNAPDEKEMQAYRGQLRNDDNVYVRVKARSLLEEKIQ